jgi:hypothetical protein
VNYSLVGEAAGNFAELGMIVQVVACSQLAAVGDVDAIAEPVERTYPEASAVS